MKAQIIKQTANSILLAMPDYRWEHETSFCKAEVVPSENGFQISASWGMDESCTDDGWYSWTEVEMDYLASRGLDAFHEYATPEEAAQAILACWKDAAEY